MEEHWSRHYRMYSYITRELSQVVEKGFAVDSKRQGIFGHSMGGHGALTIGLRNPDRYRSISAFSPIAAPMHCPWGEKAFARYLGPDRERWKEYDACEIYSALHWVSDMPSILVEPGLSD